MGRLCPHVKNLMVDHKVKDVYSQEPMCLLGMKFQCQGVLTYEGQDLPNLSLKLVVVNGYMCTKR